MDPEDLMRELEDQFDAIDESSVDHVLSSSAPTIGLTPSSVVRRRIRPILAIIWPRPLEGENSTTERFGQEATYQASRWSPTGRLRSGIVTLWRRFLATVLNREPTPGLAASNEPVDPRKVILDEIARLATVRDPAFAMPPDPELVIGVFYVGVPEDPDRPDEYDLPDVFDQYPGRLTLEDISCLPLRKLSDSLDEGQPSSEMENASSKRCHICLYDYELGDDLRRLTCLHEFHQACIDQWLVRKRVCPICRLVVCVDE